MHFWLNQNPIHTIACSFSSCSFLQYEEYCPRQRVVDTFGMILSVSTSPFAAAASLQRHSAISFSSIQSGNSMAQLIYSWYKLSIISWGFDSWDQEDRFLLLLLATPNSIQRNLVQMKKPTTGPVGKPLLDLLLLLKTTLSIPILSQWLYPKSGVNVASHYVSPSGDTYWFCAICPFIHLSVHPSVHPSIHNSL